MFSDSKYSNILTIVLIIIVILILGLIAFVGYDMYRKYSIDNDAKNFMDQYDESMRNFMIQKDDDNVEEPSDEPSGGNTVIDIGQIDDGTSSGGQSSGSNKNKPTYKGFGVLGRIEIPKTGVDYPILDEVTIKSLEVSVAYYYGPGLNKVGNTTISGHNYRNGAFFGKNKQLSNGDIIYITDYETGTKVAYTIYNIYRTTENDGEYVTRDTAGKREISLTTCTDDSKGRLIIWAKEQ